MVLPPCFLQKVPWCFIPMAFFYGNDTIDRMLFERHISREMRRQKKSRSGHIKKRTPEQDAAFQKSLESFLSQHQK
ncbi:DUF188 domain-containing protein [Anaerotignum lactatifermentans]|uniref:DUF188 domain-containing protein n=1 Tax=Anaerotignum lactatifermentans TaxID=160404 RepID=UPI003FA482DF